MEKMRGGKWKELTGQEKKKKRRVKERDGGKEGKTRKRGGNERKINENMKG